MILSRRRAVCALFWSTVAGELSELKSWMHMGGLLAHSSSKDEANLFPTLIFFS